jgi:hypothetical protein
MTLDHNIAELVRKGLIEQRIPRADTEVPDTFAPTASGFLIATQELSWLVEPTGYGIRRYGWSGGVKLGNFHKVIKEGRFLWVRKYGGLWFVERTDFSYDGDRMFEVLAFAFQPKAVPILVRRQQLGMELASGCDPQVRTKAQAAGVRWVTLSDLSLPCEEANVRTGTC